MFALDRVKCCIHAFIRAYNFWNSICARRKSLAPHPLGNFFRSQFLRSRGAMTCKGWLAQRSKELALLLSSEAIQA